jgi:hypothetical protein
MKRRPWILAMVTVVLALAAGPATAQIRIEGNAVVRFERDGVKVLQGDNVTINGVQATPGGTPDTTPTALIDPQANLVATTAGDRFIGSVVAMPSGGPLRLTGPQFKTEVRIAADAIDSVILRGSDCETGGDEIGLTNGDRVRGTLSSITPDEVVIETVATGPLKVSRKIVRFVNLSGSDSVLLDSTFQAGRMEPWIPDGPAWSVADGRLVTSRRTGDATTLHAPLNQKDAVTMVAKVASPDGRSAVQADLVLFATADSNGATLGRFGKGSVVATFRGATFYLMYTGPTGVNTMIGNRNVGRVIKDGELRVAYDPATGKAHAWVDTADLGEYAFGPPKPTAGNFVIFNTYMPINVESLRVLRGVVPPAGQEESAATAKADEGMRVDFANGDHLAAEDATLADGRLSVTTPYGPVQCPAGAVRYIFFDNRRLEEPRRRKDDVQVMASFGRLTLEFGGLTAEALFGQSDNLGPIKLQRGAVREIRFNPHR